MKDYQFLANQIQEKKSMLCVGLDPDLKLIPKIFHDSDEPLYHFCKSLIEICHTYAIAFKLNVAFFESQGPTGWVQLEKVIRCIPENCLIILDAKRADIGNTSLQYANYYFNVLNVDAVTLHPYMGYDSIEPFLVHKNKWSIVLALTSNEGSKDIELKCLSNGNMVYEETLKLFSYKSSHEQIMFVCGATHPESFQNIRKICPDHFLLVPGVGAQGGDLQKIIEFGKNSSGGLIINVSRGISYPPEGYAFNDWVQQKAEYYQKKISVFL
ncbi:MAG: orotidine-5'-phosphate decarboxylase [Saprospiraceae bacterium]|nr:orotidine-5'-phosphate decarboxylase [Saprospiraceae bacterium]